MLTVYIDFKCPGSYLALAPNLSLAKRLELDIGWRGYRTRERDLPDEGAGRELIASHDRVRRASQRTLHRKYAALQGIDLRYPGKETATDLALGVLCGLTVDPVPYIKAAFSACWLDHRDLDSAVVVDEVLRTSGTVYRGTEASARAALVVEQAKADDKGVVGTPTYLLDGEIFMGRQHLPWIEDRLAQAREIRCFD